MTKLSTLGIFLISLSSFGTTLSRAYQYYTGLHFSEVAFDKKVVAVYAHVGVHSKQPEWRGGKEYWQDVRHIELKKGDGKFTGKVVLKASAGYNDHYVYGPVVQYWVYFEDGTERKTDNAKILVQHDGQFNSDTKKEYKEAGAKLQKLLDEMDVDRTTCKGIWITFTG